MSANTAPRTKTQALPRPAHLALLSLLGTGILLLSLSAVLANPDRWRSEGWQTDFSQTTIDYGEVLDGGPPRDGIPPIDNPVFVSLAEADHLSPMEPVLTFSHNGEARAYPLRVMTWHEIVNDEVGGDPVAVTYCPLCNAAIVFDRRVGDRVLDFGTTGKLRKSDLIMYDRQSDSWWQQFSGESIAGEFAGTGLTFLPSRLESFERFAERHPDGVVLADPTNFRRNYGSNPYIQYDSSARPFLYRGEFPEGIAPLARVVMVRDGANEFAVSVDRVAEDSVFERDGVEIAFFAGQNSALDSSRISDGRDVGNIVVTKAGEPVVHDVTFAFVVHAFEPDLEIIQ